MVLISISLMTDGFERLSCTYWPFVYLLQVSICSDPLPIFKLGCVSLSLPESFTHTRYTSLIKDMVCKFYLPF